MKLLKLAIVGRPNVGKSCLFNSIIKKRKSIVHEEEGVTRDRLYEVTNFFGKTFEVIDTAGIDFRSKKDFNEEVLLQSKDAINIADVIVLVVDGRVGITDLDLEISKLLLKEKKPIALAVNKIDSREDMDLISNFHSLGIEKIIPVSALHNFQIAELLEAIFKDVTWPEEIDDNTNAFPKIAIIGKPNVGKSTLLNYLLQEKRSVVSEIAGTTRDSISINIKHADKEYFFVDTAGIKKKNKEHSPIDKFSFVRTKNAIEESDICVFMLDAKEGITAHEKKIAKLIQENKKGCILAFNKWDLVKGFRMEHCIESIKKEFPYFSFCPVIFMSAMTGRNVDLVYKHIEETYFSLNRKIPTPQLNNFIEKSLQKCHPPMIKGKRLRIYYITQISTNPLRFIFFVNNPLLFTRTYKKYLINQFIEVFSIKGAFLSFDIKGKPTKS